MTEPKGKKESHITLRTKVNSSLYGLLMACIIPLAAQTTTISATCTTPPATITDLSIERVLTLSNLLTLSPDAPPGILAAITSGALEIRSRIVYNPGQGTVTDTTLLVAPGSPNPTPLDMQQPVQGYVLNVDKVYISCKPTPSVLFVGIGSSLVVGSVRDLLSYGPAPFGSFSGAPAAISIGYTTDKPPLISNVVQVIAGQVVAYSAAANGTLTFSAAPVTPSASER